MDQSGRRPKLLKDYAPPDYLVDDVDLEFQLDPKATRVKATLRLRANPAAGKQGVPLVLDGEGLTLESVSLDGTPLPAGEYRLDEKSLTIADVPARPFTLETVSLCDPEANTVLSGLYRSRGTYCTQCEPEGFRRITYFLDRPDVLAVYTVRIEADKEQAPVLLVERQPGRARRHRKAPAGTSPSGTTRTRSLLIYLRWWGAIWRACATASPPPSGREVKLGIYVEPGKEDRCAWAMESLKRAMRWDEQRFGLEYDLDVFNIVAVSDFNMGAMENKGLNIFNDKLVLARPGHGERRRLCLHRERHRA